MEPLKDEFGNPIGTPVAVDPQEDPMSMKTLQEVEGMDMVGDDETFPPVDDRMLPPVTIPATGSQYDLTKLDGVQTAEQFNSLTDAQKELFYLRHNEGIAMTPKDAANYILKRNEQKQQQKAPLYQIRLREAEARVIAAERAGSGQQYFDNGWERYKDPETGEMKMRILSGSPAEKEILNASQIRSNTAQTVLSALDEAEALVDSFGATGLIGQVTQGIDAFPAGVLRSKLDLAKDNNAIDKLLEIKKSGGTMGALNQSELELLKNIQGTLRVGLPADVLKPQIQSVRAMWKNVLSKMSDQDMQAIDAPVQATPTGEEKKVLGRMQYKYSDGSWRPTKPQQVK
jgi:hypothetical protein